MKSILALGNPGARYRDTRHNVGWWLADRLARAWRLPPFHAAGRLARTGGDIQGRSVEILKPLTYVNRSGDAVSLLTTSGKFDPSTDLLVLVDDVALPPGSIRIRGRGSSGGHNGLASIERAIGTHEYGRLRIGVGRPHDDRIDLADWVLGPPDRADEEKLLAVFGQAVHAVECWSSDGMETAMNRFNA